MADKIVGVTLVARTAAYQSQMKAAAASNAQFGASAAATSGKTAAMTGRMKGLAASTGLMNPMLLGGAGLVMGLKATVGAAVEWESAFTGVEKTVDGTTAQMAALSDGLRDMSGELPTSAVELAGVAEAAGQLGIETDSILGFTRVMADLGASTNMSANEAATALARLANITQMPQSEFDRLGSTVVALGNNMATTEAEIVEMGLRLAGAGNQVGLTEANIMSLAGALSSVGIEAQAGGTAFSKVMIEMSSAAAQGGDKLEKFADVAGMTGAQFAAMFESNPTEAIIAFVEGLGAASDAGENLFQILGDLGIEEVRMRDALLRTAGAGDVLREAIELGNVAWAENTALTEESERRYATIASQWEILKNNLRDLRVEAGEQATPVLGRLLEHLNANFDEGSFAQSLLSGDLLAAWHALQDDIPGGIDNYSTDDPNELADVGGQRFAAQAAAYEDMVRRRVAADRATVQSIAETRRIAEAAAAADIAQSQAWADRREARLRLEEELATVEERRAARGTDTMAAQIAVEASRLEEAAAAFQRASQAVESARWDQGSGRGDEATSARMTLLSQATQAAAAVRELNAEVADSARLQAQADEATRGNAAASERLQAMADHASSAVSRMLQETNGNTTAAERSAAATQRFQESLMGTKNELWLTTEGVFDLSAAMDSMIGVHLAAEDATIRWEQSLDDLSEAVVGGSDALDVNTQKGRDNRTMMSKLAGELVGVIQTRYDEGDSITDTAHTYDSLIGQYRQAAEDAGLTEAQVDELIETYGLTPEEVLTNIVAQDSASSIINNVTRLLGRIPRTTTTTIQVRRNYMDNFGGKISGARASGGPVGAGETYLVGERGPEFVTFPDAAYVHDAQATAKAMAGVGAGAAAGGSQSTTNVTINVSAIDAQGAGDAVFRALKDHERSNGPLPIRVR